jgi:hypothetical protein
MRLRHFKNIKATGLILVAIGIITTLVTAPYAHAANTVPGHNVLISASDTVGQDANNGSQAQSISYDGNLILFLSYATNVGGSNNTTGAWAAYQRNVSAGTTTRVDVSTAGVPGNTSATGTAMSKTGRYVVFRTTSNNLIDGTTTVVTTSQLYLRDMQLGTTSLISTNSSGTPIPTGSTITPVSVSADGRYVVANVKNAQTLVGGTVRTGYYDVVLWDKTTGTWSLVNTPASGSLQNVDTTASAMSCDGSLIMLQSTATNLVSSYSGSGTHVYLADVRRNTTLTDLTSGAILDSTQGSISCNGDYVAFATKDRTLISPNPSTIDSNYHLIRSNRITGEKGFVDTASNGTTFSVQQTTASSISDKGDMEFMYAPSTSTPSIYLKHLSDGSGTLENVFKGPNGTYNLYNEDYGYPQAVSANGKYAIFSTRKAWYLGLTTDVYSGSSNPMNVVRSETGLTSL